MKTPKDFTSTQDIIRAHKGHYFTRGTMRFFRSRVLSQTFPGVTEVYFVTSEQFVGSGGVKKPRRYTVRAYDPVTDDIRTVPPFNELTKYKALKIAKELAETVGKPGPFFYWRSKNAQETLTDALDDTSALQNDKTEIARLRKNALIEKLNPRQFYFSPKMSALVGAIIGHDYGVTDPLGGKLTGLSITSDGYVIASTTSHTSGAFIGEAKDLYANLFELFKFAGLTEIEQREFARLWSKNVTDHRAHPAVLAFPLPCGKGEVR